MDEGGGDSDPEECVHDLPKGRINLAASEKVERYTTPDGDEEGGPVRTIGQIS